MTDKPLIEALREHFQPQQPITQESLLGFYKTLGEGDVNPNTLLSRIHQLKKKGILASRKRGVYVLGGRPHMQNVRTHTDFKTFRMLKKLFPHVISTAWKTDAIDEIAGAESPQSMLIVETEKDAVGSVFDELRQLGHGVFLDPDTLLLERYISSYKAPVIILPLISEAPLERESGRLYPSLEKICVDIFANPAIYHHWQGGAMRNLFLNIFNLNIVNFSSLFRYASRRGKSAELKSYLKKLSIKVPETDQN